MNAAHLPDQKFAIYRRLKSSIDKNYPSNWFVAIADEEIIASASDFHSLENTLRSRAIDPRNVLVVQAGADYAENVTIFV